MDKRTGQEAGQGKERDSTDCINEKTSIDEFLLRFFVVPPAPILSYKIIEKNARFNTKLLIIKYMSYNGIRHWYYVVAKM